MLVLTASSAQDAVRGLAEQSPHEIGVASGGSSLLVRQLSSGAEADVLITADEATMAAAAKAGLLASEPVTVAASRLVLAVPAEDNSDNNRSPISSLADLESAEVDLVLCAEPVPCGSAARAVLEAAGVEPQVRSFEPNSRQALSKVAIGVADAALVWEVDVQSEERVSAVSSVGEMPATSYKAAVVLGARNAELAEEFISRLESDEGQAYLAQFGFLPVDLREFNGSESAVVGLS
jgi:molybdate transport system substrate-binding protein